MRPYAPLLCELAPNLMEEQGEEGDELDSEGADDDAGGRKGSAVDALQGLARLEKTIEVAVAAITAWVGGSGGGSRPTVGGGGGLEASSGMGPGAPPLLRPRPRPLAILVDDAHSLDSLSLQLLAELLRRGPSELLVVLVYRPAAGAAADDAGSPSGSGPVGAAGESDAGSSVGGSGRLGALLRLQPQPHGSGQAADGGAGAQPQTVPTHQLTALDAAGVRVMLMGLFNVFDMPQSLAQLVCELSGGVPLLVREVAHLLRREKYVATVELFGEGGCGNVLNILKDPQDVARIIREARGSHAAVTVESFVLTLVDAQSVVRALMIPA